MRENHNKRLLSDIMTSTRSKSTWKTDCRSCPSLGLLTTAQQIACETSCLGVSFLITLSATRLNSEAMQSSACLSTTPSHYHCLTIEWKSVLRDEEAKWGDKRGKRIWALERPEESRACEIRRRRWQRNRSFSTQALSEGKWSDIISGCFDGE